MKKRFILGVALFTLFANLFADEYKHTITPGTKSGGTVTVTGTSTFTLVATPAEGWVFSEWSDHNTDNPRTSYDPNCANCTLEAIFTDMRRSAYTKSRATNPTKGGTVSVTPGACDGEFTLTATPDTENGWTFAGWDTDENGVVDEDDNPLDITVNVLKEENIYKAIFEDHLCTRYDTTLNYPATGGTVIASQPSGYCECVWLLTATPTSGWSFHHWNDLSVGDEDYDSPTRDITLNKAKSKITYTATFVPTCVVDTPVIASVTGLGTRTITRDPSCACTWQLEVTPLSGYTFQGWVDAPSALATRTVISNDVAPVTYTPIFALTCFLNRPIIKDDVTGLDTHTVASTGIDCQWTLTVSAEDDYTFDGWDDDPSAPATRTVTSNDLEQVTYIPRFYKTCTRNTPVIASAEGMTSSSVSSTGECTWSLSVTADLEHCYSFDHWSDLDENDDDYAQNPRTVTSTTSGGGTYTPVFVQSTCNYKFPTVVGSSGSVSAVMTNECACEWEVTATPAVGWEFSHWSDLEPGDDGYDDNPRTVSLSSNKGDFQAVFNDRRLLSFDKSKAADPTKGGTVGVSKGTCDGDWILTATADIENGWRFAGWDDNDDGEVDAGDYSHDNPRTVTFDTEDLSEDEFTFKAIFEDHKNSLYLPKYTNPATGGTVTATQPDGYCDYNWLLTATPTAGYAFLKWMDGSVDNPRVVRINSPKVDTTFIAKFITTDVEVDGWTATDVVVRTKAENIGSSTATIYADGVQLAAGQTLTRKDAGYWSIPAELNSHAGKKLKITFICSGDSVATVDGIVPYVVTSPTNVSSLTLPTNTDVHVLDTLTFNADATTIAALNIYPGAKAVVPSGKTLNVSSIYMRANGLTGKYPQLVANGSIHNANSDTIYYDYAINSSAYYPLSVPYDVPCNMIRTHTGKQASYEVSWYSGDDRAHNASGWNVFDDTARGATLRPDTGFIIYAVPYKWGRDSWRERQSRVTVRFPMMVNLESGEPEKTTTQIHLYGDASWTNYSNLNWNFIGSPYLANYKHDSTDTKLDVGIFNPTDVEQQYSYTDNGVRYITNSTDGFRTYNQVRISQAVLVPFNPYFVQAKKEGTLSFPLSRRAQNAPQRFADANVPQEVAFGIVLSSTDCADRTGLLYGESFTGGYDMGDDLVKMHGSEPAFALYTLAGTDERVFNALALSAISQPVPVGFKNAPTGEMVFSFDDAHYDDAALDAVMLTDYEANRVVNLLEQDYLFTNTRAEDNTRFVIYAVLAPQTVTEIIAPAYDGTTLNGPDGIYDMLGRRVSAGDLPQGVYIVIENGQPRKEVIQ